MADPSTSPPLTRASVQAAHKLIAPYVHRTPVLTNATLTALASAPRTPAELEKISGGRWGAAAAERPARPVLRLWFKCENFQRIGAFKVRGAFHAIERLKAEDGWWVEGGGREKGVATHSSGNHAQALALAAKENGIPAYIVMPEIAPPAKIAATRGYGATVVFSGSTAAEREEVAARVIAETGARLVPPYDHPDIILGQGTMGLELQEQVEEMLAAAEGTAAAAGTGKQPKWSLVPGGAGNDSAAASAETETKKEKKKPALDAIITPCSGGGMLAGVALSAEGTGIRVFGAEPEFEGADDGMRGFRSGQRVTSVKSLTIADGLRTSLGVHNWGVIYERRLVSDMFNVTEDEIKAAMRLVYERFKLVVEPSAVVGLAVALYNEEFRAMVEREAGEEGWDLGLVLSGGNVSVEALGELLAG